MADYVVLLKSGRTVTIAGVTATPTVVSKTIKGGVYRDIFPVSAETAAGNSYGSGVRQVATYSVAGGSATLTAFDKVVDDITQDPKVAPKQADEVISHWEFVISVTFSYFIPVENVDAMCTSVTS